MYPQGGYDDDHEVEKILQWRQVPDTGLVEYLVQWQGLPEDNATWEFKEFLPEAAHLFEAFDHDHPDVPQDTELPNLDLPPDTLAEFLGDRLAWTRLERLDQPPLDNDPHADWGDYEKDVSEDEAELEEDNDTQATVEVALPDEAVQLRYTVRDLRAEPDRQISANYTSFLTELCRCTRTLEAFAPTSKGLLEAIPMLRNQQIFDNLTTDGDSVFTYGLIIAIWLIVCYRIHTSARPDPDDHLSSVCGTLFLVAAELLTGKIQLPQLRGVVQFWESHLHARISRTWLKKDWYTETPTEPSSESLSPLDEVAAEYLEVYESKGLIGLVSSILEKEGSGTRTPLRRMLKHEQTHRFMHGELLKIFASMDSLPSRVMHQETHLTRHGTRQ